MHSRFIWMWQKNYILYILFNMNVIFIWLYWAYELIIFSEIHDYIMNMNSIKKYKRIIKFKFGYSLEKKREDYSNKRDL